MGTAQQEPGKVWAGVLSLFVHLLFLGVMIFGLSWQTRQPEAISVDLWSKLPVQGRVQPQKEAVREEPVEKTVEKPIEETKQPKIELTKTKPVPVPEPKLNHATLKPDIALKEKERKIREEKSKKEMLLKQEQQDKLRQQQEEQARQAQILQQLQARQLAQMAAAQQSAVQQSVVNEYTGRIKNKIRRYVNSQLCGTGNPELEFEISLMPTGQLLSEPVLRKSSGMPACDQAVERAIRQAEPLPVPSQPEIFSQFRDLRLKFRPNETGAR